MHPWREMDITQEQLKALLSYDPETGVFTRIAPASPRAAWRVGSRCGTRNKVTGYIEIHVYGANHYGHRLAWIYMHGAIPEGMRVDHQNQDRSDNRAENLRLATHADNLRNCKVRVDNTSGVKGVSFDPIRKKWTARVSRRYIGRFDTLEAAAGARRAAAEKAFGAFASE
jgi:hypothetical protein